MDLGSCYLGGNADAVEFCPHRPFRHVLAAATYTLQEQEQDRAGSISLFSVDAAAEDESQRLRLLHTVETAGVFDMKWSPASPLLAQADAHGRLALRRLEQDDGSDAGYNCLYIEKIRFMPPQLCEIGFHVQNHATQWHGFQHEIQFQEIVVAWIQLTHRFSWVKPNRSAATTSRLM